MIKLQTTWAAKHLASLLDPFTLREPSDICPSSINTLRNLEYPHRKANRAKQ
jgi:hypothetical protein